DAFPTPESLYLALRESDDPKGVLTSLGSGERVLKKKLARKIIDFMLSDQTSFKTAATSAQPAPSADPFFSNFRRIMVANRYARGRRSASEDRTRPAHPSRRTRSSSADRYQVGKDTHWRVDQIMFRRGEDRQTYQYLVRYGGPEEYPLSYLNSLDLGATTQDNTNSDVLVRLFDDLMSGHLRSFERCEQRYNTDELLDNRQMELVNQLDFYCKCLPHILMACFLIEFASPTQIHRCRSSL